MAGRYFDASELRSPSVIAGLLMMVAATFNSGECDAANFVIRNVRVFDGEKVSGPADVWVDGRTIKNLGQTLQVANDTQVIDGTGATLLPGFIDAHTHAFGDALRDAIIFGVTTELDMFTDIKFVRHVKQLEAAGKNPDMADLRSAGTLATVEGGHGTEYGFAIPTLSKPQEAKGWVKARVQERSDYIKIVYDDCRVYGFERPTLTKETMRALIDAAHARPQSKSRYRTAHDRSNQPSPCRTAHPGRFRRTTAQRNRIHPEEMAKSA